MARCYTEPKEEEAMHYTRIAPQLIPLLSSLVIATLISGCASVHSLKTTEETQPLDLSVLEQAAEEFYAAPGGEPMEKALERALAAGPDSAIAHELGFLQAYYKDQPSIAFDHLVEALRDPLNDAPLLHLHLLQVLPWSHRERHIVQPLLRTLKEDHPDPFVRDLATHHLSKEYFHTGEIEKAVGHRPGFPLEMAWIGAWDNDQGNGFDQTFPPETEILFGKSYEGPLIPFQWRTDIKPTHTGVYGLVTAFTPNEWVLSYGLSAIHAEKEGAYLLQLGTSSPTRVWVNGVLVFSSRAIRSFLFDQFPLPIELNKGPNRILVKTALRKGNWKLSARLTAANGEPATGLSMLDPQTDIPPVQEGTFNGVDELITERVMKLPPNSLRRKVHEMLWADWMGLPTIRVKLADNILKQAPQSFMAQFELGEALNANGEAGRATDIWNTLYESFGSLYPRIQAKQASIWRKTGMKQKARDTLIQATKDFPESHAIWLELSSLFADEKWTQDQCNALEKARSIRPGHGYTLYALASCKEKLKYPGEATAIYKQLLRLNPTHFMALSELFWDAIHRQSIEEALPYAKGLIRSFPHHTRGWFLLGDAYRRSHQTAKARKAFDTATALDPIYDRGYQKRGTLAYEHGDVEGAINEWQQALARNPNNASLQNRLAYLDQEEEAVWMADVPSEAEIEGWVAKAKEIAPPPGANAVRLLDDGVTRLHADGSTTNFTTIISHAINEQGRDKLTKMGLTRSGRNRVLSAYAVAPSGERTEASSIRQNTIRFRGLQIGSTVVLQYRTDSPPLGYLSRYLANTWFFQAPGISVVQGRWVVWLSPEETLHEARRGEMQRTDEVRDGLRRVAWEMQNQKPILGEKHMPPLEEVVARVLVSTVPDWQTFILWEEALLEDVFRDSPELNEAATTLLAGTKNKEEALARIHQFVMQDIRYQQDYENHIAGVKPHAAPVVLERLYGDCKDKTVLFTQLAKKAGIEVHFALVRTRNRGPLERDVPMQQFNHVVPYIPVQDGISAERFIDPTADALDLLSLRQDNAGTLSLVYDPVRKSFEWREIQYQAPKRNRSVTQFSLTLEESGSATGTGTMEAEGMVGSQFRILARNEEQLDRALKQVTNVFFPGSDQIEVSALEVTDLMKPAQFGIAFKTENLLRLEGGNARMSIPLPFDPKRLFVRPTRQYPMEIGVPQEIEMQFSVQLPKSAKIKHTPSVQKLEEGCLRYEREVTRASNSIKVVERHTLLCSRIAVEDYSAHRNLTQKINQFQKEEIVLQMP